MRNASKLNTLFGRFEAFIFSTIPGRQMVPSDDVQMYEWVPLILYVESISALHL